MVVLQSPKRRPRREGPASDRFRDGKVARNVPQKLPKSAKKCHFRTGSTTISPVIQALSPCMLSPEGPPVRKQACTGSGFAV